MTTDQVQDPLGDGISRLALIDRMGSDITVVNAAKVSFHKYATEVGEKEEKLLRYLLVNEHPSPFYHPHVSFVAKVPLFVKYQWWKHQVGCKYTPADMFPPVNEVSLRYVQKGQQDPLEFYVPSRLRAQSKSNKQASSGHIEDARTVELLTNAIKDRHASAAHLYNRLIESGVARELARGVLPENTYTEFRITMSLWACLHFIRLRDAAGAQYEIAQYAKAMREMLSEYFPVTVKLYEEIML